MLYLLAILLSPLTRAADPAELRDRVMTAVGSEIGSYIAPIEILTALTRNADVSVLIDAVRVKGGFDTVEATLKDFWQYNEPELSNILGFFLEDVSRLAFVTGRRQALPKAMLLSIDALIALLTAYCDGLDLAIWKYLPAGFRSRYHDFFRDISGYRVERVHVLGSKVLAELPSETGMQAISRSFYRVDATLLAMRYLRSQGPDQYQSRWIDLSRGKAAERHLLEHAGDLLRIFPSFRLVWTVRDSQLIFWRADSLEPVIVAEEIRSAKLTLSPDGEQIIFNFQLLSNATGIVAYPTMVGAPLVPEKLKVDAAANPFKSGARRCISSYPWRRSKEDVNVSSVGGLGVHWRVVDDTMIRVLAVFRQAWVPRVPGNHDRQFFLRMIFKQIASLTEDTIPHTFSLIEMFIRGRPYETASLYCLIKETIAGNPLALEEIPESIDDIVGEIIVPHLVRN